MDKELHERSLEEAIIAIFVAPLDGRIQMQSAIAAYLKTAGLTVVPVEATEEMIDARFHALGQGGKAEWDAMLAAFPSPFDEVK